MNNRAMFVSYLEKKMTALLPREIRTHWFFLCDFSWDEAAINPLVNSKYSLLLHCRLKFWCFLPCAWLSWALTQRQYQPAAFLKGTLDPLSSFCVKDSHLWRKTATQDFSQPVWSSLSISTTERNQEIFYRNTRETVSSSSLSQKGTLWISRMRHVQWNITCSVCT